MNNKNSWMLKHIANEHEGKKENVEFSWKVLQKHNKPLQRQIHEAVRIKNKSSEENLNSKSEYHSQRIKRIEIDNSYDCKICGSILQSKHAVKERHQKFHQRLDCEYADCEYKAFGMSGLIEHLKDRHNKNTLDV